MGIPAVEDELFANLLICVHLNVFRDFCKSKGREGKGKGKDAHWMLFIFVYICGIIS